MIGDGNPDFVILDHCRDAQEAISKWRFGHCVHAVTYQIEQYLLQHQAVRWNEGQCRNFGLNANLPFARIGFDEAQAVVNYLAQCAGRAFWLALADKIMDPANDLAGTLGLGPELFQRRFQILAVDLIAGQQIEAAGVVTGDGR